jgi:hypothetical protein
MNAYVRQRKQGECDVPECVRPKTYELFLMYTFTSGGTPYRATRHASTCVQHKNEPPESWGTVLSFEPLN